jgi:hypothetical protein
LREVAVVGHGVEGRWVVFGERRVGVLAVEALLVAINPIVISFIPRKSEQRRLALHGLPIEPSRIADRASVRKFSEVDFIS